METESESESSLGPEELFTSEWHAKESLRKMKSLCLAKKLTDVTLVASEVEITAHRLVLSSASDYFFAMFTGELMEASMNRVHLEDTDPVALRALVEFCYSAVWPSLAL
ncbi:kelch-like protein 4 [Trichonephila clavipes]|nr:kelch-like protein 4 [Trichonephila clavipes]